MASDAVEFSNEEDYVGGDLSLDQFGQAVLWGTDWTVETVIAQLKRGNIDINPRFQRRDAWSRATKSRFIESIILGLPVPQVVLAENPRHRGRYIILDGKQRLLSIMQFAGIAEGDNNGFGLSSLEVRDDLARKRYRNFERDPNLQKDLNAFLTHTIRAVVIRNWPSLTFLHIVFQRLNTGSLKLSPQELRQALTSGGFTDFVDDQSMASAELHRLLGRTSADPRMRDIELLVRFLGFQLFLGAYKGRMKEFLDFVCVQLNADWEQSQERVAELCNQFRQAVSALEIVFGDDGIARKRDSRLFNRSIFDALAYYAADQGIREAMLERAVDVRNAYHQVIDNVEFQVAVESDTAGLPHTAARLKIWGETLANVLQLNMPMPILEALPNGESRFRL